jgi:DNA-directed RNA polymerase specialized sigma24 family protein
MDAEFGFIAETLDMKPGAVRTALHRALEKLKEILGEEGF